MKEYKTKKELIEAIDDYMGIPQIEQIKTHCMSTIFRKYPMSISRYKEIIKYVFEVEISIQNIAKWKKEYDEKQEKKNKKIEQKEKEKALSQKNDSA